MLAVPVAAQTEEGPVVEVVGVEYAYQNLPTSLPAGTSLGFTNADAEVHELVLVRIGDDVTATLEDLLTMEEDPMEAGLVEMIGEMPLFTGPGETAEGSLPLETEQLTPRRSRRPARLRSGSGSTARCGRGRRGRRPS